MSGDSAMDSLEWLRAFEARHGRPLRALHIGNIANNALLNAKFLRTVGVDVHVMSHDYQHVMATPEWEEVELQTSYGDDHLPRFSKRDLQGYRRPDWFVSGPLPICFWRLRSLNGRHTSFLSVRKIAWSVVGQLLMFARRKVSQRGAHAIQLLLSDPPLLIRLIVRKIQRDLGKLLGMKLGAGKRGINSLADYRRQLKRDGKGENSAVSSLLTEINAAIPSRSARLTIEDLLPYQDGLRIFQRLFAYYDVVQAYATEPIYALLTGKRPYVAFEHGTLRHFTTGDCALHRLTALAYQNADHTFVTNGDCLAHAKRLGLEHFSSVVHPIDVEQHRRDFGDGITKLRREIGGEVILFSPIRHDWEIKGIDVHLRALPLIKARLPGKVKLVLIRWGGQLAESEGLLESSGCADDVVWRPSMCRITMIKHIRAADIVLDQMALPHFGATAPQAIAAGTPVISSYEPKSTEWIIPEPAPIMPAFSPEEVADAVERALDPDWRSDYVRRAQQWTDRYHHPNNVIEAHLSVYRRLLEHDRQGDRA